VKYLPAIGARRARARSRVGRAGRLRLPRH
jgi:hypothetical protein